MTNKNGLTVVAAVFFASMLLGCQNKANTAGVDEKKIQGFDVKTFFNRSQNIEVTVASDGKSTIVAVPRAANTIARMNNMGDDEFDCLKKCKDIADLEKRLNCILLCPVTKKYQVFIF